MSACWRRYGVVAAASWLGTVRGVRVTSALASIISGGPRTTVKREWTAAVTLAVAAGLVRLVVAALVPVVPDEAYYWEGSRHLAAGYFDHPGAIAWLIRAGTLVAGPTPLGVRLGVTVAGTVATLAVLAWARRLGGDRAAWDAALAVVAMLLAVAVGLWALDHALETDRLGWWAVTGLAIGAGGCAKYTAVLIPITVAI